MHPCSIDVVAQDSLVLIVDNDVKGANLLKTILEGYDYQVDVVSSGVAALGLVKMRRYSSIVMDFALGDIRGDELATKIKKEVKVLPIILLTGYKSNIKPSKLKIFDFVLEKPADPQKIVATLQFLQRRVKKPE
jgi:two-component system OmpR family response regulator